MRATPRADLTVLMPVYNAAPYLREAIDSILTQSYRDFEFLIIDDGSTDDSVAIIQSYSDSRIRLLHNECNLGLIATLNKGLDLTHTRYLARMDADDISRPQRLERQMQVMMTEPAIIACGTAIQKFGAQSHALYFPCNHAEIYCGLLFTPTLSHPAILFDMELLRQEGYYFDPGYAHAEDYELWTRLGTKYRLRNLPEILYDYRMHDAQVSKVHAKVQIDNSLRIQQTLLNRLGIEPSNEEMALQRSLFTRQQRVDFDYLMAMGNWFDKVLAVNDKSGHFDRPALLKYLGHSWFYLAYRCSHAGNKVSSLYRSKPYVTAPLKNRLKLAIKCTLHLQ